MIVLEPKTANYYILRASVYEKTGAKDKAIADYRKALEIDPSNKDAQAGLKRLGAS